MIQDVQSGVVVAIRTLLLHLCEPVYKLIVFCFQIFEGFGKLRLFENSDVISGIYNRIGLILGLFMIFRISFAAIEYIINPDNMLDKEKGFQNIIKKVLIVVVLLGSTRFLFDTAYDIQERLIDSQIVSKILLSDETVNDASKGGSIIAWEAFRTFYRINPEASGSEVVTCTEMTEEDGIIYQNFFETEDSMLDSAGYCLNTVDDNGNNVIIFNGIFCLGVGVFLLWTIFTFTLQLGVRVLQLAYLELIAPIPIMMYLVPDGDAKLKNWGQQCLTTFADFFIRLAIMNFIIIVSGTLIAFQENIFGYFGDVQATNGNLAAMYVILIMIIALMIFAKRIPSLLQEILPSMGGAASLGFGFRLPQEARQVGGFVGRTALRTAGGAVGGLTNGLVSAIDRGRVAHNLGMSRRQVLGATAAGFFGGGFTGARVGSRRGNPFTNQRDAWRTRNERDRSYEQLLASGGTARGRIWSNITSNFGETRGQYYDRMIGNANRMSGFAEELYAAADQATNVKNAKYKWEHMTKGQVWDEEHGQYRLQTDDEFRVAQDEAKQAYETARREFVEAAFSGQDNFTIEGEDGTTITDTDSINQAAEVRAIRDRMGNFAQSHHVQYWDANANGGNGAYVQMNLPDAEEFTYDDLRNVTTRSQDTVSHITRDENPSYGTATANDRAAGLDGQRNFYGTDNNNNNNNNS